MSTLENLVLGVIKMIDDEDYTGWTRAHDAVIKDALRAYVHEHGAVTIAVAAERERCAKVCEEVAAGYSADHDACKSATAAERYRLRQRTADHCAECIRGSAA